GLREALDKEGFKYVKIIVSSGFTAEKIADFENAHTPVDIYGVGSTFITVCVGYTGDLVRLDGKPEAKEGRADYPNPRLKAVPFPIY
ncbi:MAG: nicotinate phosphoribosyltransferase, partial [Firmicutes bacterium]|nr:nicotinate phosphoribosyltransferase [Bacillota bacterium]